MARTCLFTLKLSAIFSIKNTTVSYLPFKYLTQGKFFNPAVCLRPFASFSKTHYNVAESQFQSDSDSDNEDQASSHIEDLKVQILKAGLNFVPQHGWNKKSIALGANSLGLSSASHSLIEDGGADLVHYFNFLCKENLELHLKEQHSSNEAKKDIHNYVEDALVYRLQMVIPYATTWPEALALMILPNQIPVDLKTLLDLVDTIWYHSGDQTLNLSWYSKRLSLAMAYRICELTLTQDKSTDFADTFGFLQRRVENVMETNKIMNKVMAGANDFPELANGALITVRNVLGANRWFR